MAKLPNGFFSYSDSYLKNRRKQDLINYIRIIENNWKNQLITNEIQHNNCKKLLSEERNKAIDEFANWMYERHSKDLTDYVEWYKEEIEEEMRGAE